MLAAEQGNLEMVKLLVDRGSRVNSQISDGSTALKRAHLKEVME
jgi:hypothetical protein